MKVLVAGGSGVIGRQLVPLLSEAGHDVAVLARPTSKVEITDTKVVAADALDHTALAVAVGRAAPEVVVNLLTAIPRVLDPRHFARQMALTNRLRSEATANLVTASGGARIISEGLAYAYDPVGGPIADENRSLWLDAPKPFLPSVHALLDLERLTIEAGGAVLRFGHLYGPGTAFAGDGAFVEQLRAKRAPIVGSGNAMFSFLHTRDAATAIVAAIDKPVTGVLNIADDEPAYARDWLPAVARIVGAPAPKRVPVVLARLAAGAWGVAYMNRIVGADNRRAWISMDWRPQFASWRDGFGREFTTRDRLRPVA